MEKDDEVKGEGNSYTTEFRQFDSRLARWLSTDPVTHPHFSPYNGYDNNPIYFNDPSGANGEVTIKEGKGKESDKLSLKNKVYLYNADVENLSDADIQNVANQLMEQVESIGEGQTISGVSGDGRRSIEVETQVEVVIVSSEQEALKLANGGEDGNVFGVVQNDPEGSSVDGSGSGHGWRGTLSVDNNGPGSTYAHEWMHLFGLGDRYILGVNLKDDGSIDRSNQQFLPMYVPGDDGYQKGGNIMVNPVSTNISKGQAKFLYNNQGYLKPANTGYDVNHSQGIILGGWDNTTIQRQVNKSTHRYFGSDFATKTGKKTFKNLPKKDRKLVKNYIKR
jgi:RHS repeat-associated protein